MAKSHGPLFSAEARGTLADVLTFSKRKSGQQVRFQRKQKDVITADRTAQRNQFLAAIAVWNNLSDSVKAQFNVLASGQNLTGFNLFQKKYLLGELGALGFGYNYQILPGTLFEDFEVVGDWTIGYGSGSPSGSLVADTTYFKTGTQGMTVNATNGGVYGTKIISQVASGFTRVGFWAYIPSKTYLNNITFYIGSTTNLSKNFSKSINVSILKNGWNFITINADEFTNTGSESWDNTMIRMRMRVDSTAGQTTAVTFDSVYYGFSSRPKVLLTFDDGWDSQYSQAFAYMQTKNLIGTSFIIREKIDTVNYMTLANLAELYAAGWDLGTHGLYDLTGLADEAAMITDILFNYNYLVENGMPRGAKHYAIPLGAYNATALSAIAAAGLETARSTNRKQQSTVKGIDERYILNGLELQQTTTLAVAQGYVDRAISNGESAIIFMHKIVVTPGAATEWPISDFQTLMDYIKTKVDLGLVDVPTISEWYAGLNGSFVQ